MASLLSPETLKELRGYSTCAISNAIETFGVRLQNTGFADPTIRCIFPNHPPMVGYAATARMRSAEPPMGRRNYFDRTDWWESLQATPAPRIVVVQDVDEPAGRGSLIGEVHTSILQALDCKGLVTNGAVRDLEEVERTGFDFFASSVAVSHAYAHIFEFGGAVEIGGLRIHPGDLLHGDRHGVLNVPLEIASEIPAAVRRLQGHERRVIEVCKSPEFSLQRLREVIHDEN